MFLKEMEPEIYKAINALGKVLERQEIVSQTPTEVQKLREALGILEGWRLIMNI